MITSIFGIWIQGTMFSKVVAKVQKSFLNKEMLLPSFRALLEFLFEKRGTTVFQKVQLSVTF